MSQITIDLNDDVKVIRMFIGMLQEFVGDVTGMPVVNTVAADQENLGNVASIGAQVDSNAGASEDDDDLVEAQAKFGGGQQVASEQPTAEVDSAGNPWDARIHATTKTKKADGTWKAARKKKVVEQVHSPEPSGVQSESQSEATPPAGAAQGLDGILSDW